MCIRRQTNTLDCELVEVWSCLSERDKWLFRVRVKMLAARHRYSFREHWRNWLFYFECALLVIASLFMSGSPMTTLFTGALVWSLVKVQTIE